MRGTSFAKTNGISSEEEEEEGNLPAVSRALKRHKKTRNCEYSDVKWIPPTSNHVERFFSYYKHVYSDERKKLLPVNLEMQVFLKYALIYG